MTSLTNFDHLRRHAALKADRAPDPQSAGLYTLIADSALDWPRRFGNNDVTIDQAYCALEKMLDAADCFACIERIADNG